MPSKSNPKRQIEFLHPDLGIGGAERLIVDAACSLSELGHDVKIVTAHYDPNRCFEETKSGQFTIIKKGNWIPSHLFGRFRALCAIARMAWMSLGRTRRTKDSITICDLVSHAIPLLKYRSGQKVIFYCHYPDQLLTRSRSSVYQIYRIPIDWLEERGLRFADVICVNSQFTAEIVQKTFPTIDAEKLRVVHPCVNTDTFASINPIYEGDEICLLSLNRFDPLKKLEVAVETLSRLRNRLSSKEFSRVRLVIAGGYDEKLASSRKVLLDLKQLADQLGISNQVEFILSPTDQEKKALLERSRCVIYTPPKEHFGIVPLEAMAAARPVVASNSGGPCETILHQQTGVLCNCRPDDFADALIPIIQNVSLAQQLGHSGRKHVCERFALHRFQSELGVLVSEVSTSDD